MHKVIVAQFVTLDGIVEDPDGSGGTPHGGWAFRHGPGPVSGDKFHLGSVLDTGVKLLGRTTWELFSRIFPTRDDEFSRRLNAMEKLVASNSLDDTDRWANSTLLQGELVAAARAPHDLGAAFRRLVFPPVGGRGRRLFAGATLAPALASSEDAGSGVLRQISERGGPRCAPPS